MNLFSLLICEAPNIEKEHIIYNQFRYVENRDTDKFPAKESTFALLALFHSPSRRNKSP